MGLTNICNKFLQKQQSVNSVKIQQLMLWSWSDLSKYSNDYWTVASQDSHMQWNAVVNSKHLTEWQLWTCSLCHFNSNCTLHFPLCFFQANGSTTHYVTECIIWEELHPLLSCNTRFDFHGKLIIQYHFGTQFLGPPCTMAYLWTGTADEVPNDAKPDCRLNVQTVLLVATSSSNRSHNSKIPVNYTVQQRQHSGGQGSWSCSN